MASFDGNASVMTQNRKAKEQETLRLHSKTFKAWINAHLKKRDIKIENDLAAEFSDGVMLINLVEELSGEACTEKYHKSPKSNMQKIENVTMAINFVKKFVNVSVASKVWVDGDLKIMLGVIWRLILHFQVIGQKNSMEGKKTAAQQKNEAKKDLINWVRAQTAGYKGVNVVDFENSFLDGLAFCALVHKYDPTALDFDSLNPANAEENLNLAFELAEKIMGIAPLLDAEDMISPDPDSRPDEQCLMTYVSEFPQAFENVTEVVARSANNAQFESVNAERAAAQSAADEERRRLAQEQAKLDAERQAIEAQKAALAQAQANVHIQTASALAQAEEERKRMEEEYRKYQAQQQALWDQQAQAYYMQQQQYLAAQQQAYMEQAMKLQRDAEQARLEAAAREQEIITMKQQISTQEGNLIGVLKIGVVEARGLYCTKISGHCDPYVRLTLERQQEKTRKINESNNPKWDTEYQFYVGSPSAVLNCTVFDYNKILSDQFLGKIDIVIGELKDGVPVERWFTLLPAKPGAKVSGEILLKLLYQTPRSMGRI